MPNELEPMDLNDIDELEPMGHIFKEALGYPWLVIELKRMPEAQGFPEMKVTPVDWDEDLPDVIILDVVDEDEPFTGRTERVTADGRTVHIYRTRA